MGIAASGGYYIACRPIASWPTRPPSRIGRRHFSAAKSRRPDGKTGRRVDVSKSGDKKDMGSPFRASTEKKRPACCRTSRINWASASSIFSGSTARSHPRPWTKYARPGFFWPTRPGNWVWWTASGTWKTPSKPPKPWPDCRIMPRSSSTRRGEFPDDTVYNAAGTLAGTAQPELIHVELPGSIGELGSGFFYIWPPAAGL